MVRVWEEATHLDGREDLVHGGVVELHDGALLLAQVALDVVQDRVQVHVGQRDTAVAAGDLHAVHAALQRAGVRQLPPPHILWQHQRHRLRAHSMSPVWSLYICCSLVPQAPRALHPCIPRQQVYNTWRDDWPQPMRPTHKR